MNFLKNIKLAEKEKRMIMVLGIVLVIVLYVYCLVIPQFKGLGATISERKAKKAEYEQLVAMASPDSELNKQHKKLQETTDSLVKFFYPTLNQAKIIDELEDLAWETGIKVSAYEFTEEEVMSIQEQEPDGKEKKVSTFEKMSASVTSKQKNASADNAAETGATTENAAAGDATANQEAVTGDASGAAAGDSAAGNATGETEGNTFNTIAVTATFKSDFEHYKWYIQNYEKRERRPHLTETTARYDEKLGLVVWSVTFRYYSVELPYQDGTYAQWRYTNQYGKDDPFAAGSAEKSQLTEEERKAMENAGAINTSLVQKAQGVGTLLKKIPNDTRNYDIVVSSKPINADMSPTLVGLGNNPSGSSFLFSDSANVEGVRIVLKKSGSGYLMDTYVGSQKKENIAFKPSVTDINLVALSAKRVSGSDLTGINLSIENSTDRTVNVYVKDEDSSRPRINFVSSKGAIKVWR